MVHRRILSGVCALVGLSLCAAAQADIYTYALQAPAGSNGSISGTITVNGNAGDFFPRRRSAVSSFFVHLCHPQAAPRSAPLTQADTIDEEYHRSCRFRRRRNPWRRDHLRGSPRSRARISGRSPTPAGTKSISILRHPPTGRTGLWRILRRTIPPTAASRSFCRVTSYRSLRWLC